MIKIAAILLSVAIIVVCIVLPHRIDRFNYSVSVAELSKLDSPMVFISLFPLYAPLLILLESYFIKLPFNGIGKKALIIQAALACLLWPLAFLAPVWGVLGNVTPTAVGRIMQLWSTFGALWALFIVMPAMVKNKLVSWPFSTKKA